MIYRGNLETIISVTIANNHSISFLARSLESGRYGREDAPLEPLLSVPFHTRDLVIIQPDEAGSCNLLITNTSQLEKCS